VALSGVREVAAVDENARMLDHARQLAADAGVDARVRFLRGRVEQLFGDEAALPVGITAYQEPLWSFLKVCVVQLFRDTVMLPVSVQSCQKSL
jgi:predicted RNA methylase